MKRLLLIILSLAITLQLFSHPWKPSHYVIIDTDGGIDDLKAITMLLASPDVRVLAITVSPGTLDETNSYIKVKSLLNSFWHEGVPVGINRNSSFKSPQFPVALNCVWGKEEGINTLNAPDYKTIITEVLTAEKTKISFLCLGSMTTAGEALKNIPIFSQQVKQIIWSVTAPDIKEGFNYKADNSASERILTSGIPVKMVNGMGEVPFYNEYMLNKISEISTIYAEKITGLFRMENIKNHKYSYSGNDEMVALYLHFPGLFKAMPGAINNIISPEYADSLRDRSLMILGGETVPKNQVIKSFPSDPSFYFDDIEPSVSEIIKKYGADEWISGVIANELHRHLGVFAIAGVKMGIRAREYFNTGVDEFSAVSFAGSTPPLSCMNDGIQVSTGATPGHGLLTVINNKPASPAVEFTYMNRKIKLTLKPEIADKLSSELQEINFVNGLDSNIYWELVRKNSIRYWRDLDRHEIFIIEEIR